MKKRQFSILIIITVLLFNGCYMVKKSADYYGISTEDASSMVFLIDISGSMEGNAETDAQGKVIDATASYATDKVADKVGGTAGSLIKSQTNKQLSKLGKAKKELIPAIRGLSENISFTIIVFENDIKMWRKELVPATKTNKNLAITYINSLSSGGGTNIYKALEKAFELAGDGALDENKPLAVENVFLLSDGSPSAGAITNTQELVKKTQVWNKTGRVNIHCIGLGKDQDEAFLKEVAEKNNGQYIKK